MLSGNFGLFDTVGNEFTKKGSSPAGTIVMTTPDSNPNLTPIFTTTDRF